MNKRTLIASGLVMYVTALVVTAPATLLDSSIQDSSGGKLHLAETRGTLWSGSGQLEIHDAHGNNRFTRNILWNFQPHVLLQGKLGYTVTIDPDVSRPVPVRISWSQIELGHINIDLPADILGLAMPKLAALGLSGNIQLQITNLVIGKSGMKGKASLQWLAATSMLTPVSPLGDYELQITGDGSQVQATLRTLQGPLQLDGRGAWDSNSSGFIATAHTPPRFRQELGPFLRLIGVERGDGSFELQVN